MIENSNYLKMAKTKNTEFFHICQHFSVIYRATPLDITSNSIKTVYHIKTAAILVFAPKTKWRVTTFNNWVFSMTLNQKGGVLLLLLPMPMDGRSLPFTVYQNSCTSKSKLYWMNFNYYYSVYYTSPQRSNSHINRLVLIIQWKSAQ